MTYFKYMIGALALSLAACGGGDDSHGTSTDPNAATGFMTENTAPPETAADIRGDGILRDADERPYQYAYLGKPLPHFVGQQVSDGKFYASSTLNRWTVIYVWGIWCGDCMADAPYVADLYKRIQADPNLDFISIHTPPNAARADEAFGKFGSVERYFEVKGYSYPAVLDPEAKIRDLLQIGWTPSYLLVSPDGVVRGYRTDLSVAGEYPVEDFLSDIESVQAKITDADMLPDAGSNTGLLVMSEDGIGRLSGTTLFTLEAVQTAFPEFDVTSATITENDETYPVFHVNAPESGETLLTVEPSWDRGYVFRVVAHSGSVTGPDGEVPGETRFSDAPQSMLKVCLFGLQDIEDRTVCGADMSASFFHVYKAPDGYEGAVDDAPEDIQRAAILESMYYAPGFPVSD